LSFTGLPGLRIGHATDAGSGTGCTVLLGPFRAYGETCGFATGTRELDALSPAHIVPRIDALLLTGGSAFGLAAAEGVVAWLEERGLGFDTREARVPIVPAAVIYDLAAGRRRPDATMGRAACADAREDNFLEGRVGAGTGATVGKLLGRDFASPGGLGIGRAQAAGHRVLAIAVVNAFGDVLDGRGGILAGARGADGAFVDCTRLLSSAEMVPALWSPPPTPATSTTLVAVVTDAPFTRIDLARVARMATTALARRISPVNTPFDGDIVFALTVAIESAEVLPVEVLALGAAATVAVDQAIARAVSTH
jgi:L-aminopeptidase/D-esterase-like protein